MAKHYQSDVRRNRGGAKSRSVARESGSLRIAVFSSDDGLHGSLVPWLARDFEFDHRSFLPGDIGNGALSKFRPNLALLLWSPPDEAGLTLAIQLGRANPGLPLIALASRKHERSLIEMIRTGAMGCLVHPVNVADFCRHIVNARDGLNPICPITAQALVRYLHNQRPETLAKYYKLSARDLDMLHQLQLGRADKGIASQLGITLNTVKEYLRRLYRKLGVHSRTEALTKLHEVWSRVN